MTDQFFMKRALELGIQALNIGEVPVGALIVRDNIIISEAYNTRETDKNALAHAEITAINEACKKLSGWRLWQCDLYVTLEPCPMCAGAIVNSRIKRVIYGAKDSKAGAFGSVMNINSYPLNHKPEIISGIYENEARELLQDFFKYLRNKKKKPPSI
jgi:Cytosine/adenosine deaminases